MNDRDDTLSEINEVQVSTTERQIAKQEETNTYEGNKDGIDGTINDISTITYLARRFYASLIDKFIIVILTVSLFFVAAAINQEYAGELGTYTATFHMMGKEIEACAIGNVMKKYPGDYMNQHQSEIDEYHSYLVKLDVIVTFIFALLNAIYYYTSEIIWRASFGKHTKGFRLMDASDTDATNNQILWRVLLFLIIMAGMIGLRWFMGVNYYIIIVLFFLIMDIPVLFTQQSLLEHWTGTVLKWESHNVEK